MKTLKRIWIGLLTFTLVANQLLNLPILGQANAAQSCFPATIYYGTVTVDGMARDGATVTLTDMTSQAASLSATTALGGVYQIDSANLTTCPVDGDSMSLTAVFNGAQTTTPIAYSSAQPMTNVSFTLVTPVAPVVTVINITPVDPSIGFGATLQLSATALDQSGAVITPAPTITWTSNNAGVVTVDGSGMVTGISAGTGTITATAGAVSGTTLVTVNPPPVVVTPVLTTITLTPTTSTIASGSTGQLTATTLDQSGATMNPTPILNWTSSDPLVASVDQNGVVTGVASGTTVITASSGAVSGTASVTITSSPPIFVPILTAINVTPVNPMIASGAALQLSATALDQSGGTITPAPTITWTSDNAGTVTVDGSGMVTGISAGTGTITATAGAVSGTTLVTVNPPPVVVTPVLTTITLTPTVASGGTTQLSVSVLDQSGSIIIPPPAVTWTSSNTGILTVNGSGVVTGISVGTAVVTATYGTVSGTLTMTVTLPNSVLTTINVTPVNPTIGSGATAQLSASSLDQSGGVITPTPAIAWTSDNTGTVTVDGSGMVTGISAGTGTITATSGTVSGTTLVTVTPPAVNPVATTISVSPVNPTIKSGSGLQLSATVLDQSGALMTPTPAVTWTSSNTGAVAINGSGMITGVSAGTGMITATSGTASGTTLVTVISKILTCEAGEGDHNGETVMHSWSLDDGDELSVSGSIIVHSDDSLPESGHGHITMSGMIILVSGATWNGRIIPPTKVTGEEEATEQELSNLLPKDSGNTRYTFALIETIKAGWSGTTLAASGSNFIISLLVPNRSAGEVLKIFRSSNGNAWEANAPDASCTVDTQKMCTFETNHLSYFVPVAVAAQTVVPLGSGWAPLPGGGGGGGGGGGASLFMPDSCPLWDNSPSRWDGSCTPTSKSTTKIVQASPQAVATKPQAQTTVQESLPAFRDIANSSARNAISRLVEKWAVHGYGDGTFRPNRLITRAEFLTMVMRSEGISVDATVASTSFSDIPREGSWMIPYIEEAKSLGIIKWQVKNKKAIFRPNDPITKSEILSILRNIARIPRQSLVASATFMSGVIPDELRLQPNDPMTRAEAAETIVHALDSNQ